MRDIDSKRDLVKANQPAPPALPNLTEACTKIERLGEILDRLDYNRNEHYVVDPAGNKRALKHADAMKQVWGVVSQPATEDQIATALGKLALSFPNLGRDAEREHFARTLIEDVGSEAPSLYVLDRACHAVRTRYEFLSIKAVISEIKAARKQYRRMNRQICLLHGSWPLCEEAENSWWREPTRLQGPQGRKSVEGKTR